MATLSLHNVQPGMVLDHNVVAPGGRLLLTAGTPVTTQHLQMLDRRGITHVDVAEGPSSPSTPPWSEAQQLIYAQLFRHHHPDHPLSRELMRLYRLRNGGPETL